MTIWFSYGVVFVDFIEALYLTADEPLCEFSVNEDRTESSRFVQIFQNLTQQILSCIYLRNENAKIRILQIPMAHYSFTEYIYLVRNCRFILEFFKAADFRRNSEQRLQYFTKCWF